MSNVNRFGRIFPFNFVERYVLSLAETWFTEYLAEVERIVGRDPRYFPALADWGVANDWGHWPEEHLPFLLVTYAGLNDQPVRKGDGTYDARTLFGASVIVSTPTRSDTREAMHVYGAAFKAMLLQHRSLGHPDDIGGITWADERPRPVPSESEKVLGAMNMFFYVDVKNVLTERGRPPTSDPREDPYDDPGPNPVVLPDPDDPSRPRGGVDIRPNMETP